MPRYIYYAMEAESLKAYLDHKNLIAEHAVNLSTEKIDQIKAQIEEFRSGDRVILTVDESGTARMTVTGVLEPKPDLCALMFGIDMTTYSDIIDGVLEADSNPDINRLEMFFDTPGGNIVGLFKACDAIRNASVPIIGIVTGMAASAGYALISQCDEIIVENDSNEVGSIGVRTDRVDRSEQDKKMGIARHTLVSENAPNKVSDVTTEEGRAKIVERITKFESVFIDYVSVGRNVTVDFVKENFGQGGMLIAREAAEIGMIDEITSSIADELKTGNTDSADATGTDSNLTEGEDSMEMTQEQIEKIASDAASQAVAGAEERFNAKLDERDNKAAAEKERLSGFAKLKDRYPEMSGMIDEEASKEGATADMDFVLKVADADKARLAELEKQKKDAKSGEDQDTSAADQNGKDTDNSGNILAGALGLPVGGK